MDNDKLIERMRSRVEQLQRMDGMAHDRRIHELLAGVIGEIEADIERLSREEEANRKAG